MPTLVDFFEPFDLTYAKVSGKIRAYPTRVMQEHDWLEALIVGFQKERDVWEATPDLDPYFAGTYKLRHRILQLAVSAFLHISYDLPRVIAENWPGGAKWPLLPTFRGQWIFFDLAATFPQSLQEISRDRRVLGYPSYFTRLVPPTAMEALGHWVLHLRTAAWIHARLLHEDPVNRAWREQKMLQALIAALHRVSDWSPWSGALLMPPNPGTPFPAVFGLTAAGLNRAWVGAAGVALIGAAAAAPVIIAQRRDASLRRVINHLGYWTYTNVTRAALNPASEGDGFLTFEPNPA